MVTYSGYELWRSRWSSHFWIEMHVFQLLSTIKVQLVDEMMESFYLCVILRFKHKKWPFIGVLTWFLILGKIQNGGQNGDHCWCRHRPPAAPPPIKYTSSCWEDQRLSTKGKIGSKYCSISKTAGRGSFNPPPPPPLLPLCRGGGMNCVYVQGLRRRLLFTVAGHEDVSVWKIFLGWSPRDQISILHWPFHSKKNFLWRSVDTKSSFLDLLVLHRNFLRLIFYRRHPYV